MDSIAPPARPALVKTDDQPVTLKASIYAGIWCKMYSVQNIGTVLPQHAHDWDHLTMIVRGRVALYRNDILVGHYSAPELVHIPARELHSFETLSPGVVLACIHNANHAGDDGEPRLFAEHHLVGE